VKLKTSDYVHLHNHTQYSLLDGLTKVPALVDYVKEKGMTAVAITDHGTMSGAIELYKEAKAKEIKPIIGMETYIAARSHLDKDAQTDKPNFHLILLAKDNTGYENLMKLSTIANLDGFYYKPRIDHELLEKHSQGLIVLSGCIGGEFGDLLRQNQIDKAIEIAKWYKSIFKDNYYIEIQDHGHPDHPSAWDEQVEVTKKALKIAKELGIECVLTSDAHYLKKEDETAHEILLCVQTGSFLSDEKRMSLKDFELNVADPKEIIDRWGKDYPELILNTKKIADKIDVSIKLGDILIPKFEVPKGKTEETFLAENVYHGLAFRYGGKTEDEANKLNLTEAKKTLPKDVLARAEFELGVINSMGFNGYFLIISDFINWGKNNGIAFGPGRGSAAGSIISYALKITEIDPLKYDLLFERFLNPDRISMPDIDIDIQDSRRDEVIQYCVEKYGSDRVANIVTFGRMAARNAIRDVARVLEIPYSEADRLAKMIPPPIQGRHTPLAIHLVEDAELKSEYENNKQTKKIFDLAVQLEGTIRSHGVHAAGVVIAPENIVKYAPLEMAQKGVIATQYSMGPVEELGLLKMDFLGLSNLTIINNALRTIKKVYGDKLDINKISLEDEATFKLLSDGDTTGVFQFESAGMKRYLKELQPTQFEDIVAMVALYRPGPMQFIDDFIARKHGTKKIDYPHPKMENALQNTYGVLVYQEQVMQISKEVAGFSGGDADMLRKAIGKKNAQMMAQMKDKMIDGALRTSGIDKKFMEKFWKQLEDFAAYCFNKSHAACYGLIAYQTAYLKAHYPSAFMAAIMTSDYDDTDRLSIEISECQRMGIDVLPPDINESFLEFAIVKENKEKIRFGMLAIKNVGSNAVDEIIRLRSQDGPFKSLQDFFSKINPRIINRKNVESLIKSGAFDKFGDREEILFNLDNLMAFAVRSRKELENGQIDLFGDQINSSTSTLRFDKITTPPNPSQKLVWERELLGIYITQHPLDEYKYSLKDKTIPINELTDDSADKNITIGGMISDVRMINTRNGSKMAFVILEDLTGSIELVLFPKILKDTQSFWTKDRVINVSGTVSSRNGELKFAVESAGDMSKDSKEEIENSINRDAGYSDSKSLYIKLQDSNNTNLLNELKRIIDNNTGDAEVVLVIGDDDKRQAIRLPMKANLDKNLNDQLSELVGQENFAFK
jgi:DNA polymerase III subunit alpha